MDFIREQAKRAFQNQFNGEVKQIDRGFSLYFNKIENDVEYFAGNGLVLNAGSDIQTYMESEYRQMEPEEGSSLEKRLYSLFEDYGKTHENVSYIYFGNYEGGYVQWPKGPVVANYDPRIRPWFVTGKNARGKVVRADAYYWVGDDTTIVSTVKRVSDAEGRPVGVIGIDVTLDQLTSMLDSVKLAPGSAMMLIEQNGRVIADTRNKDNNFKFIHEIEKGRLASINYRDYNLEVLSIDGIEYMVSNYDSLELGWRFVSFVPAHIVEDRVKQAVDEFMLITLSSILSFVLISFIVASVISRTISHYIRQVEFHQKETEKLAATRSHFLKNVSHLLRTSLNHIHGYCQYLLTRTSKDADDKEALAVQRIFDSSNTLKQHIDDIYTLVELETGSPSLEMASLQSFRAAMSQVDIQVDFAGNVIDEGSLSIESRHLEVLVSTLERIKNQLVKGGISCLIEANSGQRQLLINIESMSLIGMSDTQNRDSKELLLNGFVDLYGGAYEEKTEKDRVSILVTIPC
nr:cache domain-containing protein [Aliikangiella sp. G2MR2-5]